MPGDPRGVAVGRPRSWATRILIVAFVMVGATFAGAAAVNELVLAKMDDAAVSLTSNASPSLRTIVLMQQDARELEIAAADCLRALEAGEKYRCDVLRDKRAAVETDLQRYLALPTYAGEVALQRELA